MPFFKTPFAEIATVKVFKEHSSLHVEQKMDSSFLTTLTTFNIYLQLSHEELHDYVQSEIVLMLHRKYLGHAANYDFVFGDNSVA